jgi:hypothetical protein
MTDVVFLKALRDKLKGGNIRSIHLNILPGRYATRLDLAHLNLIEPKTSSRFLEILLSKSSFEFNINFDGIDLNSASSEEQKKLGLLAKRLNSLHFENEDYYKEHGSKTFGFGFPILIKRSKKDINKVIKAPLFIWPLEIVKSMNKVNTWSILRNKVKNEAGKIVDEDIHSVGINEVLSSFIATDEGITIPQINEDFLEDAIVTKQELIDACFSVLEALNAASDTTREGLMQKFNAATELLPDGKYFESITSNHNPWIHFGGVFGLFRAQKESIITDIDRLIERYHEFEFEKLKVDGYHGTALSSVETDPSQQQILNTLSTDTNKIIQGPPGTGKSQSLTALITNALTNGLKCLVVCEKKTALDVIKNNLSKEHEKLGELAAIIEDISKDRDAIVNSVRDRVTSVGNHIPSTDVKFGSIKERIERTIEILNNEHSKLDQKIFSGKTWTSLTGEFLKISQKADPNILKNKLHHSDFLFDDVLELQRYKTVLNKGKRLFAPVKTLNHPLDIFSNAIYTGDNVRAAQMDVEQKCEAVQFSLAAAINASSEHSERFSEWKNHQALHYHPLVQELCLDYFKHIDGTRLNGNEELPEKLPLEIEVQQFISHLKDIRQRAEDKIKLYEEWLLSHYSGYYSKVKSCTSEYIGFATDNHGEYGELFFKNTGFLRFQIKAISIFSGRYKRLKSNREELCQGFEKVKDVHQSYSYIDHEYITIESNIYLKRLVDNIKGLETSTENWYRGNGKVIQSYLTSFKSSSLHQGFEDNAVQIKNLEDYSIKIISDIGRKGMTKRNFPIDITMKELIELCDCIVDDLEDVIIDVKKFREDFQNLTQSLREVSIKHGETVSFIKEQNLFAKQFHECHAISTLQKFSEEWHDEIEQALLSIEQFRNFFEWKQFFISLSSNEEKVLRVLIEAGQDEWEAVFESWYYYWLLAKHEMNFKDIHQNDQLIEELFRLKAEMKDTQVRSVIRNWTAKQTEATRRWQRSGMQPTSLYNKRGSRGERRNSLRKIIRTDFDFFTSFFPVLLISPSVCSSVIPLQEGLFDIVIFDEASQLRLEDTFPALVRGKYKIISGDSQQMPPSSYFQGGGTLINPEDETEEAYDIEEVQNGPRIINNSVELADSESLLMYAENSNYRQSFLKVHYRSQHPALIDFSNHAFYGKRLIPMPPKKEYTPIRFIDVQGIYEDQVNRSEALQVVDILLNHIKPLSSGKMPSVGVATFNLYQRNLILEEIIKARQSNPEHDKKINGFGPELFVKNLENIQGDERDIMILSTTFGRRKDGTFRQMFGPILQKNGYKLLNVIITRAKHQVFIVSSIPSDYINQWSSLLQQLRNNGRAVFYTYLAYAKAVSDNNTEIRNSILDQLYSNCDSKVFELDHDALGSESPFEDEVYYRLAERIGQDRIEQQFKIGGFRVDMVVRSQTTGEPMIAIECDGAKYHSSNEAYAWDMFRQKQIENYGLKFHRIWSTNWWLSPNKELDKLIQFIYQFENSQVNAKANGEYACVFDEPISSIAKVVSRKKVEPDSELTVKADGKSVFKIKFSGPNNRSVKSDSKGCILLPINSVIAESLLGHYEGDICKLGLLDNYYEILKVE